jgi:hypothetical protein
MMNDFLSGFLEELVLEICRGSKVRGGRVQSKFKVGTSGRLSA